MPSGSSIHISASPQGSGPVPRRPALRPRPAGRVPRGQSPSFTTKPRTRQDTWTACPGLNAWPSGFPALTKLAKVLDSVYGIALLPDGEHPPKSDSRTS